MKNAKIGKYGRDEILVTGIDLFTHEKCQSTVFKLSKVEIPVVKISVFQLISIDNDKFCTLIDILGNTKADLKLPETTSETHLSLSTSLRQLEDSLFHTKKSNNSPGTPLSFLK